MERKTSHNFTISINMTMEGRLEWELKSGTTIIGRGDAGRYATAVERVAECMAEQLYPVANNLSGEWLCSLEFKVEEEE